jgi:hypothetical protein
MDPIPGFRSIWLSGIMLAATSIALIDTTQADTGFGKSCRNTSYLKQQVTEVLGDELDFRKPFFTSAASKAIRECVSMTY